MLLNQLREITGIQDSAFLHAALKAANGDLMEAVSFLTEEHAQEPNQNAAAAEPSAWEGSAVGKQLAPNVTALTPNNKEDLQAVIACSLLESPKAQAAEREVERAQEAHSAENKNRSKRKRCEVWGENPKQNDWRRVGDWPVGMKNIGNTCWFSAVIQSLFQLPEFRRLVLGYSLPQSVLENCRSRTGKRNIAFMQELQCLFALMLGTHRKFVDPSAALELLRDAFRSAEEQQQDVSEFTHKLLDWLEDAFQLAVNVNSPGDKSENPMVQLFYGTFLTEGVHEGNTFSKIETFGQYPLQVNGYRNLNECLEGAMVEGEMDEETAAQSVKYGQERWFTKLPPVLTFELSRFEFNQSLGQPEKIHTRLEFPQTIYMDRYLYSSKELIQMKREEIKRLKEKIVLLQQKLEKYMKYGSGPTHFPLPDMLQYVLEFITTKPAVVISSAHDSRTTVLQSQAESHVLDRLSQQNSVLETKNTKTTEDTAFFMAHSSPQQKLSTPLQPSDSPAETTDSSRPAPHMVSEEEMNLVRSCLQRWRSEIEQDMQDLKDSIARINLSIEQMYCDPLLQQVPYRLHAVLVHEGQANAGHYWAYVYDQPRKSWLKYNDISVTESSWEELERDSFGGLKNASAYCLMYISDKVSRFVADEDDDSEVGQFQKEVEALPPELKHYIQEDNWRLEQEAEEWEEEQSCKIPQIEPSPAFESQDLSSESGPDQSSVCEQSMRSLSSEHAMIAKEQTAQAIANTADAYEKNGVEAALCEPKEVDPTKAHPGETTLTVQAEQPQDAKETESAGQTSSQVSEVEIPSVGKILVRSDADGYNEEVMLSPAMQGVILAIAKARQTFDRDGSEAGLVKAFHEEYSRLYLLAKETPTPQNDARLQHVLIYFLQNSAPKQVVERTLLEQFADKNLSYDERSISIMKVARAKLREIGPDDVDMEEYKRWHEDYSLFRKVSVYLLTGLELYQNRKYQESLTYLVYAYQSNTTLLMKGPSRGVNESLIALYRRKCLLKLNDMAASLFVSSEEARVAEGINILNELIIPCMHLIINNDISKDDLDAIEVMRNRWCSYLGREDMDANLQLKLGELLPRLLDCSAEVIVLKEPPKIRPNSPYDLCSRFAAVMESIHGASTVTVK
ncbi:ubiquitin carboxyl-terminal hydrolase 28 isoform X1 [Apteryx rowi]|uniref:ubiquitin carboxyl-terminal hydrolase 28 isoform X1 n=1 Tax=Apteryx rowi TaxID=308060 RepID=UPI000E1D9A38|nr:ubiquitin carboxyl-terminal hydrolase 28 isoform X1 [Apteryx rowi]XP_025913693.1 ubiquitin carboxyl-terminal hydrolase 28 isoform X1 [Apteryx rowi]XP_025913695.1 ubiquitin carboxyl-terminal hydrolase 28 isoform X1 [Apteryx rowi]XP_025913696.1 ubiquitin carboxyl-terminal hydrolase 28 isoform X1 [Apteryx rowi]XP_025913697.1 ubiquitin carboxyl-terminal hydrolase 28 isoform X1 [Apteryx rowi]XP_025913698.1 ubiquitin carboxyl-terminal hydrolase 28 isoform X1 [Apteryx rowi]XP_025913699.1 ubiquiti